MGDLIGASEGITRGKNRQADKTRETTVPLDGSSRGDLFSVDDDDDDANDVKRVSSGSLLLPLLAWFQLSHKRKKGFHPGHGRERALRRSVGIPMALTLAGPGNI